MMPSNRSQNLDLLAERGMRDAVRDSVDQIDADDRYVVVFRDHMDFHDYLHVTGYQVLNHALEQLNNVASPEGLVVLDDPPECSFLPATQHVTIDFSTRGSVSDMAPKA
jgi:hypothetical protein